MRWWCLGFLCIVPVSAYSKSCLLVLTVFESVLDQTHIQLKPEDSARLAGVVQERTQTTDELAKNIFEVVTDSWARDLPTEDAKFLKTAILEVVRESGKGFLIEGHYYPKLDQVEIKASRQYLGTALDYWLTLHELRHRMNRHFLRKLLPTANQQIQNLNDRQLGEYKFLSEKSAMESEWLYLSQIPLAERERLVAELRSDKSVDKHHAESIARCLINASKSCAAYVEAEHASGRYSKASLIKDEVQIAAQKSEARGNVAIFSTLLGSFFTYVYLSKICEQHRSPSDFEKKPTLQKVCQNIRT